MSADTASGPREARGGAPQPRRFFYGWVILGAGAIAHGLSSAFGMLGLGVFFLPVQETFGVSKTALSGAFSLARLETALLGPVQGFLVSTAWGRAGSCSLAWECWARASCSSAPRIQHHLVLRHLRRTHRRRAEHGAQLALSSPRWSTGSSAGGRRRWPWCFPGRRSAPSSCPASVGPSASSAGSAPPFMSGLFIWAVGFPLAALMRFRPEPYGYHPDGLAPGRAGAGYGEHRGPVSTASPSARRCAARRSGSSTAASR